MYICNNCGCSFRRARALWRHQPTCRLPDVIPAPPATPGGRSTDGHSLRSRHPNLWPAERRFRKVTPRRGHSCSTRFASQAIADPSTTGIGYQHQSRCVSRNPPGSPRHLLLLYLPAAGAGHAASSEPRAGVRAGGHTPDPGTDREVVAAAPAYATRGDGWGTK